MKAIASLAHLAVLLLPKLLDIALLVVHFKQRVHQG